MNANEILNSPLEIIEVQHNTDDWLNARLCGIGGSDASCIFGMNPWKTAGQLWKEKTNKRQAKDKSDIEAVEYGIKAETPLVNLFALDFPEFEVLSPKDRVYKRAFMLASLDGELVHKQTGRKGVLEIKTSAINSKATKLKWDNGIPDYYYIQVLHYLAVTDYSFAILKAQLKDTDNDGMPYITTKHYLIDREKEKVREDIFLLVEKEEKFWDSIVNKKHPPLIIPNL